MTVGSGIGGQLGVSAETTYGTYVAPTRFLPALTKAPFKKVKNTVTPPALRAGNLLLQGAYRKITTQAATGSIETAVVNKGFGLLLQALMGTSVTPVQQSTTAAYLQTHTLADPVGKFLSMQVGVPDTTGTARPYTLLGTKVTDAQFNFEVDKEVTATINVDAKDITESETLASASFSTGVYPFIAAQSTVKIGTYGSEAAVTGVKKASVKIERSLKTDRFYLGASGLKAEPIVGDFAKLSGTITADYVDKTIWADKFAADTPFSLVLEVTGATIESTYRDTFRIILPACYLDGDTPTLDGPDIISGDFPFVCLFDGTNLPKIEYISVDTTV